ncbi:MAG: hypothetical protein PHC75_07125 [Burkholderiales bacterium]|nr:hypothetical protein [Burkholderiales bacterium]
MDSNQKIPEIKTRQIAIGILIIILGGACMFLLLVKKGYFRQQTTINNIPISSTKPKVIKMRNSAQTNEQNNMTEFSFTLPKH